VNLVGDQLVVYFTGVHTDLRRQLRAGMSKVVMERMMFGESAREMVKNYVNLNLPPWAVEGFISYLTDGWDAEADARWKALIAAQLAPNFYLLAEQHPELTGKAFWKWVADIKGPQRVKELLHMMRIRGSAGNGVKSMLGLKERSAQDSCLAYFRNQYRLDSARQQAPDTATRIARIARPGDGAVIRDIRVSPSGRDVAYIYWKNGEYQVRLQRVSQQATSSAILSGGREDYNEMAPDPEYPLLAWSNDGFNLAILYRKGRETRLRIYNATKGRTQNLIVPNNRFDRVLGMTFVEDNTRLVFSAIKKSQTDLYDFRIKGSRLTPITNDVWDDVAPWYVSGGFRKGLLFLSNRPAPNMNVPAEVNVLPTGPMNAFFYNTVTQSSELVQASHNEGSRKISQPIQYGPDNFAYLDDSNGIRNQYVVIAGRDVNNMDSAYGVPITNLPQSILYHQYTLASNRVNYVLEDATGYSVYQDQIKVPGRDIEPTQPALTSLLQKEQQHARPLLRPLYGAVPTLPDRVILDSGIASPVPQPQIYQSEFEPDTGIAASGTGTMTGLANAGIDTTLLLNPAIKDSTYLKLKAQPYRHNFKLEGFSARVDNTVLFTKYQSVATNGVGFTNPPLGGLITASLNDALENHRFTGGIRIPTNLRGGTYFLQYENVTRRWDWGVLAYRDANSFQTPVGYYDQRGRFLFARNEISNTVSYLFQGTASYPFDRVRRVGFTGGVRLDKLDWKAQDSISLKYLPEQKNTWLVSRAEYVFDNSIMPLLNVRRGLRYKVYVEGMLAMNGASQNPQSEGGSLSGMYNIGFDVRHYQRLYRNFTLASRFAGAHSGGQQKILYFLGGVDNWILPKNATGTGIGQEQYAFQALATNLRGYKQGARNGNSYAVLNEELRLPVWNTFVKRPIKSTLLQNLQLVGFADVGAAWNGLFPNGENMQRPVVAQSFNNPVTLVLDDPSSSGVAIGYGMGLRTTVLGYFVRADAAWNIDGLRKPILYLSFGTDF
jgi:hypothetical protein